MGEIQLKIDALADASRQIQKAIPYLHSINTDPDDCDSIQKLGQLYNGIIGTFTFSEDTEIFYKLKEISELINNVTCIYLDEKFSVISSKHIEFLNLAVNLSVEIINLFAEKEELDTNIRSNYSHCIEEYSKLDDVYEKENLNQDEIDKLLDNL